MINFKSWLEFGPGNFSTFEPSNNTPEIVAKINAERGTGAFPTYGEKPPVPKNRKVNFLKKFLEKR